MQWALDSIPAEIMKDGKIEEFQINFNQESVLNDIITINTSPIGQNIYYIEGVSQEGKNIFQSTIKLKP